MRLVRQSAVHRLDQTVALLRRRLGVELKDVHLGGIGRGGAFPRAGSQGEEVLHKQSCRLMLRGRSTKS